MADPNYNVFGTETNPLALAWRSLPANVRQAYASVPNVLAELSPGAAVRDTLDASGRMVNNALSGDAWGAAGSAANMATAAAGVIPGGRAIGKAAKTASTAAEEALIRAYHGSPHNFDRFDASKIGTGEGAQAYGHGLYFAEKENVAKAYRDMLSEVNTPEQMARAYWDAANGDTASAIAKMTDHVINPFFGSTETNKMMRQGLQILKGGADPATLKQPGSMYEVNLHADPQRFLDWDKPLSGQGAEVQKALRQSGLDPNGPFSSRGGLAYEHIADNLMPPLPRDPPGTPRGWGYVQRGDEGQNAASVSLREANIPGIRYLDQGSRAGGEGSRNYVIFPGNEHLIEIVRKYGFIPVTAAGAVIGGNALAPAKEGAY